MCLKYTSFKFWWSPIYLFFFCCQWGCYLSNHCVIQGHNDLYLFSSKSFVAFILIVRSVTCFELIFAYGIMWSRGTNFILLVVDIQLSRHNLLKRLLSSWYPFWKPVDHKCKNLFLESVLFHWSACLFFSHWHTFLDYTVDL